jgi:hypothetical protein
LPIVNAIAPKGGERREIHDDAHDPEQRVHRLVDGRHEPVAALAHVAKRQAEQHRHDEHRQEIALGDGADHIRRDHLHQKIDDSQRFGARHVTGDRLLVQMGGIDVQAGTGLEQISNDEPHEQRQSRDDLEIK